MRQSRPHRRRGLIGSEQRVDERRQRTALREDEEAADHEDHEDHRDHPPELSLPEEREDLAGDLEPFFWQRKRSEEHTSELQSRLHLVCRLLLEKKKQP